MAEGVRQHAQRAQRGVNRVQVFDLVIEIALDGGVEFTHPCSLNQDFQEEGKEIEIVLCGRKRKRVDLEVLGFEADAEVGAAEKLSEAFKTSAKVKDERMRIVFLEIGNKKVEEKRFARAGPAQNHRVGNIAVMQ